MLVDISGKKDRIPESYNWWKWKEQ